MFYNNYIDNEIYFNELPFNKLLIIVSNLYKE